MIHPLRQYHRRMVLALGFFLPVAFVLGITARKPVPVMGTTPAALAKVSQNFTVTEWAKSDLFSKSPVQTSLLRANATDGGVALSFVATRDFVKPDLLVYFAPGNIAVTDTLPDEAVLLGSFSAPTLPIPGALTVTNGVIILYSLANGEIVDVSRPIQFNPPVK